MKFRTWMWNTAMCLFAALAISFQTFAQTQVITSAASAKSKFTTFDPPGSLATNPTSINPAGAITGSYFDASHVAQGFLVGHGFLRAGDGTITTFDPPGSTYTQTNSINAAGAITGNYYDESFVQHGFLRAGNGSFTTFDPPGAIGTAPSSINPAGAITGFYIDAGYVQRGFLWSH